MHHTVVDNRVAPSITATSNMKAELGSKVTLSYTASGNPTQAFTGTRMASPLRALRPSGMLS